MRGIIGVVAGGLWLATGNAGAVELYANDVGWWSPPPVVVVQPTPVVHYVTPVRPVHVYDVTVRTPSPADPEAPDLGLVEVGAGYGGFYMPSLREPLLSAPRGRLALILDPVSVAFDVSVATHLEWGTRGEDGACDPAGPCGEGRLVQASLGFAWRWNRDGVLHPTAGAGLELATLDPAEGDDAFAFTAAATAGLIFEYPLPYGAFEAGLDLTAHALLVRQDAYPLEDPLYLTFGGYAGYRF